MPRDAERDMVGEFAEMIRLGHAPKDLLKTVIDPGRDRGEHFWQFKDRLSGKNGRLKLRFTEASSQ